MELVSVVVIVYNSSKTIIETLESVKEQTYPMIELVISDDCSKDKTMKIVEKWVAENKKYFYNVKMVQTKKNTGVSGNCNRGVTSAKGNYIQLLSGDDILPQLAVEEKYRYAKANDLPIVITKVKPFGKNAVRTFIMQQYFEEMYQLFETDRKNMFRISLSKNCIHGTMVNFYKKDLWKKMGGYEEKYPMNEDWPFIINVLQMDIPILLLDKELYSYRVSGSSLSNQTNNSLLRQSTRKIIFQKNIWLLIKNGWWKDIVPLLKDYFKK